jgi:hypothetical protein
MTNPFVHDGRQQGLTMNWRKAKAMSEKTTRSITEKDGLQNDWYKQAKKMTVEELPEFIRMLTEDYRHDYGTIVHAVAAAGIAAAHSINNSKTGGITGFQASCVMWKFITNWMGYKDEPLKLIKGSDMLYPQYENKVACIDKEWMIWLQTQAEKILWEHCHLRWYRWVDIAGRLQRTRIVSYHHIHTSVVEHLQELVAGIPPFGMSIQQ